MGDSGASINITADALEYGLQKFLKLFGKDAESAGLAEWFKSLQATALKQTASVQCLGMRNPLPFDSIYQPTRLIVGLDEGEALATESYTWDDRVSRSLLCGRAFDEKSITIDEFLRRDQDALIFSGPGWGKTTFLHHIFRSTVKDPDVLPVFITLRRPSAVDDLETYVNASSRVQKKQHRACTLLLVDGYDEVNTEKRKRVSEALLQFQARHAGKFYLTCREYYQVSQLTAPEVRLEAFTREDQVRFVGVFLSAFALIRQDAEVVVSQLEERGFAEFLSHPLLLTLACIVRTSSTSAQPRSGLRLLQRALDVLCFQWDEQKHIDRQESTPLDGHDRQTILKSIAFRAKSPYVPRQRAEETTRKQLALLGMDKVDPRQALMEIARFYGILVPAEDGYEFVHRTIHDFLAAQLWVESGAFAQEERYEWNGVLFYERRTHNEVSSKYAPRVTGRLESDFIRLANSRFLDFIVEYCCDKGSRVTDLLVAYAAIELYDRRLKLMHQTYEKAVAAYKTDVFTFVVPGAKQAQLQFLNPVLQNRMKDYKAAPKETGGLN